MHIAFTVSVANGYLLSDLDILYRRATKKPPKAPVSPKVKLVENKMSALVWGRDMSGIGLQ